MRLKLSIRKGLSFGFTSGIITTLGLMITLNATTASKATIIGGILTIAFADALSDSLGIHISEESGRKNKKENEIWESTFATFISKVIFALTFLVPVLLLPLNTAIIVSIIWGLLSITIFSYYIAKHQGNKPASVIFEHLVITVAVIILSQIIGFLISRYIG
jgi:VIT1/CCC1 family predicted Fe2+/Mn2+ transporter